MLTLPASAMDQEMRFNGRFVRQHGPFRCGSENRFLIVNHTTNAELHQFFEQRIDKLQQRGPAAKVIRQRNDSAFLVPSRLVILEDAWVGEAKSVNTLLHITNKEQALVAHAA